jgi:hypothetical protein
MGCCSKSVVRLYSIGARPAVVVPPPTGTRRYRVQFEYVGRTALTAVGPVSGKRYRFDHPGVVVVVDPRDRPGLAVVPNLRAV